MTAPSEHAGGQREVLPDQPDFIGTAADAEAEPKGIEISFGEKPVRITEIQKTLLDSIGDNGYRDWEAFVIETSMDTGVDPWKDGYASKLRAEVPGEIIDKTQEAWGFPLIALEFRGKDFVAQPSDSPLALAYFQDTYPDFPIPRESPAEEAEE